ncbi:MAG: hypothetical protein COX43_04260, partial [Parcubacteria group bacterium CG23_combo_of_CG06-09_8_20_14_all_35_9]
KKIIGGALADAGTKFGGGTPVVERFAFTTGQEARAGKNSSGEYVYLKDKNGNFVKDNEGNLVINHDLDNIAEAFVKFAKEQKFSFWE